jgi:Amt family ammonium transporter
VGGFLGTVLAAVFAAPAFGGKGDPASYSIAGQLGVQLLACAITAAYTAAVSFGLLRLVSAGLGGLRVDAESEMRGLDLSLHDEAGYNS